MTQFGRRIKQFDNACYNKSSSNIWLRNRSPV